MDGHLEIPPVFYRTSALWGRCPKRVTDGLTDGWTDGWTTLLLRGQSHLNKIGFSAILLVCGWPFWAAALKESMTNAFTHMGDFLLLLLLCPPLQIPVSRPKFWSQSLNPSLKAQIPASRPKFQPRGPNFSLKVGIWASRLGFGP